MGPMSARRKKATNTIAVMTESTMEVFGRAQQTQHSRQHSPIVDFKLEQKGETENGVSPTRCFLEAVGLPTRRWKLL